MDTEDSFSIPEQLHVGSLSAGPGGITILAAEAGRERGVPDFTTRPHTQPRWVGRGRGTEGVQPVSGTALAGKVPLMVEYREKGAFDNGSRAWEHRLFLVFAPSPEDDRYVR